MPDKNSTQIARFIAQRHHRTERRKREWGTYLQVHIEQIVARLWNPEQKDLGYLHDVPEKILSNVHKAREKHKQPPLTRHEEEVVAAQALDEIATEFTRYGIPMTRDSEFMQDLNALTKRKYETYEEYSHRLIAYAHDTGRLNVIYVKLADLENNMVTAEERKKKLYENLHARLKREFPDVKLRPQPQDRAQYHGQNGNQQTGRRHAPGNNRSKWRKRHFDHGKGGNKL